MQFRVIVVTDPHRPSATGRGDYNTLRRSLALSVNIPLGVLKRPRFVVQVFK